MASAINLTTLAAVKVYADIDVLDTGDDAAITALIPSYSQLFEKYLNRWTHDTFREEIFSIGPTQNKQELEGFPVDDEGTLTVEVRRTSNPYNVDWDTITEMSRDHYVVHAETGIISFGFGLWVGPQTLNVRYWGGMALDTTEFMNEFPDITLAINQQIAFELSRRNSQGQQGWTIDTRSETFFANQGDREPPLLKAPSRSYPLPAPSGQH